MKRTSSFKAAGLGSIRTQLLLGFGILSILVILLLAATLITFGSVGDEIDGLVTNRTSTGEPSAESTTSLEEAKDGAYSAVARSRAILILTAFFVVLICLAMAVYFIIYFLKPIESLTDIANEIGRGNLEVAAGSYRFEELNEIGRSLERIAAQLRDSVGPLEQMLEERTRALITTFKVSRQLSTILNKEQLASEVAEQVRSAFNYYHVHIYLLDESGQTLELVGGTGAAGRAMLAARHALDRDSGLVGKTLRSREVVLVPDVTEDPEWLPNPLLPETKSEVAVPIIVGDEVAGVLDVQQNETGALGETDAVLLQSISNQVAIGLQNAQLYDEAQRSAYHAALVNTVSQRIQQASSVEDVLQIAARELGQALGAPKTTVRVGGALEYPPPNEDVP